jgi:hypothetical protein
VLAGLVPCFDMELSLVTQQLFHCAHVVCMASRCMMVQHSQQLSFSLASHVEAYIQLVGIESVALTDPVYQRMRTNPEASSGAGH